MLSTSTCVEIVLKVLASWRCAYSLSEEAFHDMSSFQCGVEKMLSANKSRGIFQGSGVGGCHVSVLE